MNIVVVGLDYKTATGEIREKLSILESQSASAIAQLVNLPHVTEASIINSFERLEIQAFVIEIAEGIEEIIQFLSEITNLSRLELQQYLLIRRNQVASFYPMPFAVDVDKLSFADSLGRQSLETVPKISSLRNKAEIIRAQELEKALSRLGREFTHKHQQVLEILTKNIVNKILHESTVQVRSPRNIEVRSIALQNS